MKALKSFYLLTLAAALAFAGCSKDDGGEPRPGNLTIEKTEYALDAAENRTATVSLTAAADWTLSVVYDDAESTADWLTVTPASGTAGSQTVEMAAARNFRTSDRTAYADITCGEQCVRLTVTQAGASEAVDFTARFDPDFAQELQKQGLITDAENITPDDMEKIAAITELSVSGDYDAPGHLTSLQGIEYFESLTTLECYYNSITTLDVSANTALTDLGCSYNQLTTLDLSANTELESLGCDNNSLTTLDLSANTKLTRLYCRYNSLTTLDLSANTMLHELYCSSNSLTSINLSKNTALTLLECNFNSLTTLDLSANTALSELNCSFNSFTTLDVSANTALTFLVCSYNSLTSLDVSKNTALERLDCDYNSLASLDVNANSELETLICENNKLASLDVSKNTKLTYLACNGNLLTALDVSVHPELQFLYCTDNQLTKLDLSANTKLEMLYCNMNPGDGVSKFPITAWFDNETVPASLYIYRSSWEYGETTIDIDFRKAE